LSAGPHSFTRFPVDADLSMAAMTSWRTLLTGQGDSIGVFILGGFFLVLVGILAGATIGAILGALFASIDLVPFMGGRQAGPRGHTLRKTLRTSFGSRAMARPV